MQDDLSDARLEREIEKAQQIWLDSCLDSTKTPDDRAKLYQAFARLVGQRSDAQIDRMERIRRLK